jgi:hypothetical protein
MGRLQGLGISIDDHESNGCGGHDGDGDECSTFNFHVLVLSLALCDASAQIYYSTI